MYSTNLPVRGPQTPRFLSHGIINITGLETKISFIYMDGWLCGRSSSQMSITFVPKKIRKSLGPHNFSLFVTIMTWQSVIGKKKMLSSCVNNS